MSQHLFRVFPNEPMPEYVSKADGLYIYTQNGQKYLDTTAGSTSYAILGWSHPEVIASMQAQLARFCHMDYKFWANEQTEQLADLLLANAENRLSRVYFAGNSGAEACEAAMKMSFQSHQALGHRDKNWFISRKQSYHGATTDAMALSERPNLEFYKPLWPHNRARISQHHPFHEMHPGETLSDYSQRCAEELEQKILHIGAHKVAGFVAETMMGGLVGDVPPAPDYWKNIRAVCDRYQVHLILDEVYCGSGSSGKMFCCDWDGITPDFLFISKTLAAGFAPMNAVFTTNAVYQSIQQGQGRLQHTTTHQAYSLGVAAALAVQTIVQQPEMLAHIRELGQYMRTTLTDELQESPFYADVRGRGLRFSFEYRCQNQDAFGLKLSHIMKEKHHILISGKWHRVCFTPAFIMTHEEADRVLDTFIDTYHHVANDWK